MTAGAHVRLCRNFRVDVPPERAMHLFTPVGERLWADGWAPAFPAGEHGDGGAPGTVFLTEGHHHGPTYWTVTERYERLIRYARTTPGLWSGYVEVEVCDEEDDGTRADVTYDLTALTEAGAHALREFCDGYDAYIDSWATEIRAALAAGRVP